MQGSIIKQYSTNSSLTILIIFLFVSALTTIVQAQENGSNKAHFITFKPQFFQIKDAFNYGLAHSGLNLAGEYSFFEYFERNTFSYSTEIAFGVNYNKGIGLAWRFKPVDLFYGYLINKSTTMPLTLGPYFSTNYQWQLYPELQSGHLFWFTSLEIGPRLMLTLPYKNRRFNITFTNSFAGLLSRPAPATEKYFYSLTFADFIENAHRNLEFGFNNKLNHTCLELEVPNTKGKKLSLAYELEYFAYYQNPDLSYLSHSFNLKWKMGKKKKENQ